MPVAAVPKYLGADFKSASPGMRFGMYLKLWGINRRSQELLWKTYDVGYEIRGKEGKEREVNYENKTSALSEAKPLGKSDKEALQAVVARQSRLAQSLASESVLQLDAQAAAPFTTGLGNEHPLENGFSFLWPYGLPYLPGSGVKGVLRNAAQELAAGLWGDGRGWGDQTFYRVNVGSERKPRWVDLSIIDVLFGREPPPGSSDHVRGALTFWDVIPQIAGDSLLVEIMTPHQSHYYQKRQEPKSGDSVSPHDSGQPNPIAFLTVPPGSTFLFHVVCDEPHLKRLTANRLPDAPDLLGEGALHWKALLTRAFEHAFQWLGFGAKTAVGYGAMRVHADSGSHESQQAVPGGSGGRGAAIESARTEVWENANLSWKPGPQELTASKEGRGRATVKGAAQAAKLFADPAAFERLQRKREVKNVRVEVRVDGNHVSLTRILN
jgi:CRISPR-associated protein Cmr6